MIVRRLEGHGGLRLRLNPRNLTLRRAFRRTESLVGPNP
jgi:hypothetical protein